MARSIQCPQCGVVLNLPENVGGRRLKCPKCSSKFVADETRGLAAPSPNGSGLGQLGPDSTFELTRKSGSVELPVMPTAPGDLRETFDLPMMTGEASPASSGLIPAAGASGKRPAPGSPGASGTRPAQKLSGASGSRPSPDVAGSAQSGPRAAADALALFEDRTSAPRRKTAGDARAQARRCPTCGAVVSVGMSLCQTCGLDLETGMRVGLDDDLSPASTPRSTGLPLHLAIVGGICAALSGTLVVAAAVFSIKGNPGAQYFIPVALFGVYASVQFLRVKSVKLLLVALTIGAAIDLAAFVALPVYNANVETTVEKNTSAKDDPEAADVRFKPVTEQLDFQQLQTGFGLLAGYAALTIYLLSPSVQRYFRR